MIRVSNAVALVSDEVQKLVRVNRTQAKVILNWSFCLEAAVILSAFYRGRDNPNEIVLNNTYKR